MTRSPRVPAVLALLGAIGSAELAVRLLTPRDAPPTALPVDVAEHFSPAEIARGRGYARPQAALGLAASSLDAAALCALVASRRARRSLALRAGGDRHAVLGAAVLGAGLTVALDLPGLPLRALARRRSLRIGLATQSWRGWAADLARADAIGAGLAAAGAGAMTALARRYPSEWWLPAAGASAVLVTGLATLAPVLLAPIFNDFTPLPRGEEIRSDVFMLAAAAGVRVGEVYSMDASRRTTAANAYVTGLGPTKRVVLFDTLLERYSREEIRVVVAHELAHVRHRDVPRGIALAVLTAPASALATQRLSWALSRERATPAALPALALALGLVSAPVGALGSRLSRALERRADWFSLQLTDAPEAFVSFERTIALQNVADLTPPRILSVLASHPPTGERLGLAHRYATPGRAVPAP